MSKSLIGTDPDQVPVNGMLGTAAFVDAEQFVNSVGDMVFELTNNTTLTVKVKGSDGIVRSVALTLA